MAGKVFFAHFMARTRVVCEPALGSMDKTCAGYGYGCGRPPQHSGVGGNIRALFRRDLSVYQRHNNSGRTCDPVSRLAVHPSHAGITQPRCARLDGQQPMKYEIDLRVAVRKRSNLAAANGTSPVTRRRARVKSILHDTCSRTWFLYKLLQGLVHELISSPPAVGVRGGGLEGGGAGGAATWAKREALCRRHGNGAATSERDGRRDQCDMGGEKGEGRPRSRPRAPMVQIDEGETAHNSALHVKATRNLMRVLIRPYRSHSSVPWIRKIRPARRRPAGMKGRGKLKILDKTRRRTASVTRPGIGPGSPWWEASRLTDQPPWPLEKLEVIVNRLSVGSDEYTDILPGETLIS
ncbi:hypothetical protein PR048_027869 [Dryococelus australis]|uniref:Uncharacterized protein n=1 Tax=Dryococelus australis TaxID=614101 RepID=A0ABQ9GHN8_9NEOP|nr:hypothetical protein PR048_027869 [Dryococelus australis]